MTKNAKQNQANPSFLKGLVSSTMGSIVAMGANIATVIVAVRSLEKDAIGAYFLILIIVTFANTLSDLGLRTAAIRFLSSTNNQNNQDIERYLLSINTILSIIAGLVLWLLLPTLIKTWPSDSFQKTVWLSVPISFLMSSFNFNNAILAGLRLFKPLALITPFVELVKMAISILAIKKGLGVEWLLYSIAISRAIGILISILNIPGSKIPLIRHRRANEIFAFSGWMYGSSLLSVINVKMVDLILTTYMGTISLAAYSTAMQIPSMIQKVFESVRPVVLGYLSSLGLAATEVSIIAVRILSAALTISSALLIVLTPYLIHLIFSTQYEESIPIMQLLSTWMTIGLTNYFLLITLTGMGKSRRAFFLSIPQFIVAIISSFLLVPQYQGIGAAGALIITSLVGNMVASRMVAAGDMKISNRLNKAYLRSSLPLMMFTMIVVFVHTTFIENTALLVALILTLLLNNAIQVKDLNQFIYRKSERNNA